MQRYSCVVLCALLLLLLLPHAARCGAPHAPEAEENNNSSAPARPRRPIAFATLAASTRGGNIFADTGKTTEFFPEQQQQGERQHEEIKTRASAHRVQEYIQKVPSMNSVIPLVLVAGTRRVLEFSAEANSVVSIVAQLLENRYDKSVPPSNCFGLFINVEVRPIPTEGEVQTTTTTTETTTTTTTEEGEGGGGDENGKKDSQPSAWMSFWNALATILDSSSFCDLLPTVMMRVSPAPVRKPYYFIITARHGYVASAMDYTCQMRVFIEESPVEQMYWKQNIFAFYIPLLFIICTTPFIMRRIDLLPVYLVDIDIISWLWYLPCFLRDLIISMVVGCSAVIWGMYTERRARERQRRLEEQHQRLMQEAQNRPSMGENDVSHSLSQQEKEKEEERGETVIPVIDGSSRQSSNNNNNNNNNVIISSSSDGHGEGERHQPVTVHIRPPPPSSVVEEQEQAEEERGGASALTRKRQVREEKQKLLGNFVELDMMHTTGVVSPPQGTIHAVSLTQCPSSNSNRNNNNNNGMDKTASTSSSASSMTTRPRELLGTPSMCVVHVSPPTVEMQSIVADTVEAESNHNHRKKSADESRAFLYKEEEDEEENVCRICRDGEEEEKLVSACECTGSVRWVHRTCLDRWRLESAKRNVRNVNRCEICKKPFNISIRRRTLLWQGSRHFVFAFTLFISSMIVFAGISYFFRATLGELSCTSPWRGVSYATAFNLDGIILTMFVYFMLTLLASASFAIVYGRWHVHEETEAHVHEFQLLPEFWTRRNVFEVIMTFIVGIGQALSFGYLLKLYIYRTSTVVWNWEASPSIGAVMYMSFLSIGVSIARKWQQFIERRAEQDAQNVVVDASPAEDPQQQQVGDNNNNNDNSGEQETAVVDGGANVYEHSSPNTEASAQSTVAPPERRIIRAVEYCPRRPAVSQQRQ